MIFRAARTLDRALAGDVVVRFESVFAHLTRVDDDSPVAGRQVERVFSRGKHLLICFSGGVVLRTHMRMSGTWHVYRPGERWQRSRRLMRIVVETARFVAVAFGVHSAEFLDAADVARHRALSRLGPDLLADDFDVADVVGRMRERPATPIGEAVLDQRVMAGAGNVFKSETLFLCGVNPRAPIRRLDDEALRRVVETARRLLRINVRAGAGDGIVTYFGMRRTTGRSDPASRLWVYGRARRPCRRCGTTIVSARLGEDARTTYWCPRCQPAPDDVP